MGEYNKERRKQFIILKKNGTVKEILTSTEDTLLKPLSRCDVEFDHDKTLSSK